MRVVDDLICDPAAFVPGGVELNLSEEGIAVRAANWGESDIEVQTSRTSTGVAVTDRQVKPREPVLMLKVSDEGKTNLPTAAHRLQSKIGEWQSRVGWLQRDFLIGGAFAGSLACRVHKASIDGLSNWKIGSPDDVVLKLLTDGYWFAIVEQESAVVTEESARELQFELATVLGTAPGQIRILVKNLGASDWRGMIFAAESRDHPGAATKDTTAALAYDAAKLTLKGGSTDIGGGIIEHASLTAGWLTILNSKIAGVGHMTHKGVRRLWARAQDLGEEPGDVELRLRWRALGGLQWSENAIVPSPLVDAYQWLDMGECRPQQAVLGDERWEWELQARAPGGSGKVRVHRVVPAPTEQYMVLNAPDVSQAADLQSQKSPGTVENDESLGTEEWKELEKAKVSDNTYATAQGEDSKTLETTYLKATNFGFTIPVDATILGIAPSIERAASAESYPDKYVEDKRIQTVKGGVISGTNVALHTIWATSDNVRSYGGADQLFGRKWLYSDINASSFGVAIQVLLNGNVQAKVDAIAVTVYYTEAADENRICFASRSVELRSDGVYRQVPGEDDVWGLIVPEGFLPAALPSGLEGRPTRGIIIATQGDLDTLADSGTNKLSAQVFTRGGFHYAREAAS